MKLKETILEILCPTSFMMQHDKERISKEITALIEKDYYPKEFVDWTVTCIAVGAFPDHAYIDCDTDQAWRTLDEVYNHWFGNVKEAKDTITDVDLKQIDQASDEYYNRPKLFERKK